MLIPTVLLHARRSAGIALAMALLQGCAVAPAAPPLAPGNAGASASAPSPQITANQEAIYAIARDAYVFAYPLVTMDITRRQAINVPDDASVNMRAPANLFAHARAYPKGEEKDVVRFNFDTLYSFVWLDVGKEPMIVSVPDTQGRYYLLPMLDMWSDVFAVVGTRTTGTRAGHYAVVPPGWTGNLPEGITRIVAPTPSVWVIGRTKTDGPTDYPNVHKVQNGYRVTPLSQWGKAYTPARNVPTDPAVDNKTPPLLQVNTLDGVTMLTRMAQLLTKYPPHANDYPMLLRLRDLGIEAGKPFDASRLAPETVATINRAAKDALDDLITGMKKEGNIVNGWNSATDTIGTYGTAYRRRAIVALAGLGANLAEDAVYETAFVDEQKRSLDGRYKYTLHFPKGQTPPANAFWSLTMYDKDGFQIANPLNRYAVGSYDKLRLNADGSLDLYVQADSPGKDREANWLPAPRAEFQPTMRIYSPERSVLERKWVPPPLKRTN